MDKLRSPGGCPWDAEQTHQSLLKYLLEESYEFIESVENNDRQDMQEELG
ncbi:MAG: MazG nucleotide pyrophosphohydrolase domain-containing protein, partial [Candidatus Nanopelagicus sp.]